MMKKLFACIVALLLVFSCGTLAFAEETWLCPACGATASSKFCTNCGAKRPDAGTWFCPNDGTECKSKFCPQCGTARPEASDVSSEAGEIVLVNTADVCVIISDMKTADDIFSMKIYLENKSDLTVMFSMENAVANGYVANPYWTAEIAPGKKKNDTVSIYDLSEKGIADTVSIFSFDLRAYDSNDWSADALFRQRYTLYPLGESSASIKERETQSSDILLVDNQDISITVTGFGMDDIWGYTAHVYLVNKTDTTVMFACDDASVNGFILDPFWACEVPPAARCFTDICWSTDKLEENGIEAVQEIEITFRAYDNDNWMADDIYRQTATLNP